VFANAAQSPAQTLGPALHDARGDQTVQRHQIRGSEADHHRSKVLWHDIRRRTPPSAVCDPAAGNIAPDSDGYVWIKQDKVQESFCQDLPADEALVMAVTQKAPVGSTAGDTISDPAWQKRPTWYQVSTNDRMIHPDSERQMAERIRPRSIIELDASYTSLPHNQPRSPT
jgi:hypothetical protein